MTARTLFAALFAAGLATSVAAAEPVHVGHWSIVELGESCVAYNRPDKEYNASPWNSLTIVAPEDGHAKLQVFFWPGHVKADTSKLLGAVRASGIERMSLDVVAISDYGVETMEQLPEAFAAQIRQGGEMTFALGGNSLIFDGTHMEAVLEALDTCRKAL